MEKVYTVEQVAEYLHLSVITIRRYIKAGKLSASKIGKDYRILESDVMRLLQSTRKTK